MPAARGLRGYKAKSFRPNLSFKHNRLTKWFIVLHFAAKKTERFAWLCRFFSQTPLWTCLSFTESLTQTHSHSLIQSLTHSVTRSFSNGRELFKICPRIQQTAFYKSFYEIQNIFICLRHIFQFYRLSLSFFYSAFLSHFCRLIVSFSMYAFSVPFLVSCFTPMDSLSLLL